MLCTFLRALGMPRLSFVLEPSGLICECVQWRFASTSLLTGPCLVTTTNKGIWNNRLMSAVVPAVLVWLRWRRLD